MKFYKRFLQIDPLIFISTVIVLHILRMVLPFVNYIFMPVLLFYFIYLCSYIIGRYKQVDFKEFVISNIYLLVISGFFISGFFLSARLFLPVFKELLSVGIVFLILFGLFIFADRKERFLRFIEIFCIQVAFISSFVSILGLIKYYLQIRGSRITEWHYLSKIDGSSLATDNNFYILFTFLGIISIIIGIDHFNWKTKLFNRKWFILILTILSLNIFFSYSRRGLILLFLIVLYCLYYIILNYNKKTRLVYISVGWLLSFISFLLLIYSFIFLTPVSFKKKTLNLLGVSIHAYKQASSSFLYRYATVFSGPDFKYFRNLVWNEKQNPQDPDSNWGNRIYTPEYPLTGPNVKIVPEDAIGYRMDSSCDATSWNNDSYSYTDISGLFNGESFLKENEYYYASVYCFVSEDFDGNWAVLSDDGGANGRIVSKYNLSEKGIWQKLQVCFKAEGEPPSLFLYWAKSGVTDFSGLKGYVVFAYPEYRIIKPEPKDPIVLFFSQNCMPVFPLTGKNVEIIPENSVGYKMDRTSNASTWNGNAYSYTEISELFKGDSALLPLSELSASVYCFVSSDFNGTWARITAEDTFNGEEFREYDLERKGTWQKLQIFFKNGDISPHVYLYWAKYGVTDFDGLTGYVIFAYPEYSFAKKEL